MVKLESGKAAGDDTFFIGGEDVFYAIAFSAVILKFWIWNWNQNMFWIQIHGQTVSAGKKHGRGKLQICVVIFFLVVLPNEVITEERDEFDY